MEKSASWNILCVCSFRKCHYMGYEEVGEGKASALQPGFFFWNVTQLTFAYSKSTIETLEKGVKYVQT